jgi:hypothetical protein
MNDKFTISITADGRNRKIEFQNYVEMVNFLSQNKINYEFPNGSIEHSAYLVKKFTECFNGNFMLYTVNFKPDIFDRREIIDCIKSFLNKRDQNKVSVIVQDNALLKKSRLFYEELKSFIDSKKIQFKKFNKGNGGRFMVIENAYRQAESSENDKNFTAWVNFNDESYAKELTQHFNKALQESQDCRFA